MHYVLAEGDTYCGIGPQWNANEPRGRSPKMPGVLSPKYEVFCRFLQGCRLVVPDPIFPLTNSAKRTNNVAIEQGTKVLVLGDRPREGAVWYNDLFHQPRRTGGVGLD
jgi:hypothetical protein